MNQNKHVLIVEDDIVFANSLRDLLETSGYTTTVVHTAQHALREFEQQVADLLLLDIMLPDISGLELLRTIRRRSNMPIVIISGRDDDRDKVRGLEMGADDYITKPFHDKELLARIAALLRRVSWIPKTETIIEINQLCLDMTRRQVTLRDRILHLTPIEYSILCTLMQQAGEVVSHDDLLESVWGPNYQGDFSVLRVNISRLRHKVEDRPRRPNYIMTVPKQGYRIPADARV